MESPNDTISTSGTLPAQQDPTLLPKTARVNVATPVFRFATVRSPDKPSPHHPATQHPELEIQPQTQLAKSLVDVIAGDGTQPDKIQAINQALQVNLGSNNFFKTKSDLATAVSNPSSSASARGTGANTTAGSPDTAAMQALYETLYDNILIRTVTKSTNSEVFGSLVDNIKALHQQLNADTVSVDQIKDLRIILPEGLVLSFSPPKPP